MTAQDSARLPPLCYIVHPTTGATVAIHRGENGYRDPGTPCSPGCLNSRLPHPPTEDDISAMRHGSLIGWDTPGRTPRSGVAGAREGEHEPTRARAVGEAAAKLGVGMDAMLAATMADWYWTQRQARDRPDFTFRPPVAAPMTAATMITSVEVRIAAAADELRRLHESGEIGWTDLSPLAAYQMAFLDDNPVD